MKDVPCRWTPEAQAREVTEDEVYGDRLNALRAERWRLLRERRRLINEGVPVSELLFPVDPHEDLP